MTDDDHPPGMQFDPRDWENDLDNVVLLKGRSKGERRSKEPPSVVATPFVWRESAKIPRRRWLYGRHLIRKYVSCTVAPGAAGKSSLIIGDALAMATGRDLLGIGVYEGPHRTWLWNLEDPAEELERRIHAACIHYGIDPEHVGDRLYLDSGRDQELCIAGIEDGGVTVYEPVVEALIGELTHRRIDVLSVDPFVSSHNLPENDNKAIDAAVKAWGRVAEAADCAIELVHHLRKLGPDTEATAEMARGAVALTAAARSVRVLNRMTKDEAEKAGLKTHRQHFRIGHDKENLAPASATADWFEITGVSLPNGGDFEGFPLPGDNVGVVVPWKWPSPLDDLTVHDLYRVQQAIHGQGYRKDSQSKEWAGYAVADTLEIDIDDPATKERVKALLKIWIDNDALKVVETVDKHRKKRCVVDVGEWAT